MGKRLSLVNFKYSNTLFVVLSLAIFSIDDGLTIFILKNLDFIILAKSIGIPVVISFLFLSFQNVIFLLVALIILYLFRETIKDSFSLKKLKQKNLLQMLVLIILSSFFEDEKSREWSIRFLFLLAPWYLFSVISILVMTYRKSKREEEVKNEIKYKLYSLYLKITRLTKIHIPLFVHHVVVRICLI